MELQSIRDTVKLKIKEVLGWGSSAAMTHYPNKECQGNVLNKDQTVPGLLLLRIRALGQPDQGGKHGHGSWNRAL